MVNDASDCRDLILTDVIEVTLCRFNDGTFSMPQNVQSRVIDIIGDYDQPERFHIADETAGYLLSQSPAITLTGVRSEQGLIYTHEATLIVSDGLDSVPDVVSQLQNNDIAVIYRLADGSRYLSMPLPNTSSVTMEELMGESQSATVKVKMMSVSGFIAVK